MFFFKKEKRKSGFTLIELIVVLLITVVLAAVATVQYGKLKRRAKKAEAYQNLGGMIRAQAAYFLYHDQFTSLGFNPLVNGNTGRRFQNEVGWNNGGGLVAPTTQLYYYYMASAGKFDSSGTAIISTAPSFALENGVGRYFQNTVNTDLYSRDCYVNGPNLSSLGIESSPGRAYDWVVVGAKTRLDPYDSGCNFIWLTMIVDSANGLSTPGKMGGFIDIDLSPTGMLGDPVYVESKLAECRSGCLEDFSGLSVSSCYSSCDSGSPPDDDPPDDDPPADSCNDYCSGMEDCMATCDSNCMDSCLDTGKTAADCYPSCQI